MQGACWKQQKLQVRSRRRRAAQGRVTATSKKKKPGVNRACTCDNEGTSGATIFGENLDSQEM